MVQIDRTSQRIPSSLLAKCRCVHGLGLFRGYSVAPMAVRSKTGKRVHPTFGAKVAYWRSLRGISGRELARRAGLAFSLVYAYERGSQSPTYETACRLADVLVVRVEYLWDHAPPPDALYAASESR